MSRRQPTIWLAGGGLLAAGVVALLGVLAGSGPYTALGSTDPGALVRVATPLVRLVVDLAGSMCVGSLAFAAWCTRGRADGVLAPLGYAAVRSAARWAGVWGGAALVAVPFDAADLAGEPLATVLAPSHLFGLVTALEEPRAWLVTAGLALLLALACMRTLRWPTTHALLALAVLALLPVLATGHSSSDTGHDLATAAIMIHVPTAAIWLGVAISVLRYGRRHPADWAALGQRYARIAESCFAVLAISGFIDAAVLVPVSALVSTTYGLVLCGVALGTLALGGAGAIWRRRAVRTGKRIGLVGAETLVLMGLLGGSVVLTHLPPPAFVGHPVTPQQTLLGYELAGPPTLIRLALDWRVEVLGLGVAIVLAGLYLLGVRRVRAWPVGRTVSWLAGCLVIVLATSSGIGRYAAAMFSLHITSHMLLAMLAPLLLALGGPLSLAGQAFRAAPGGLPGPRDWLAALADAPVTRLATHPLVALAGFAGAPYALYFTGLFDAAVRFHWAHLAIDVVFGLIGYLFAWTAIGVDPTPGPLPSLARLGLLLAAMPFDILFGALLIGSHQVIGNGPAGANMYSALALPWVSSLLADQRVAGEVALVVGEVCLLAAVAVVLLRWQRADEDTTDYQRVLSELAQRRVSA